MRGAILWLLGVAAVASLPLSDPPTLSKEDLLQMILNARPEDNDLEGDKAIEVHPESASLSVPGTTQSPANATDKVASDPAGTSPADDASTPVVATPEQEQVQQQQVQKEEEHEQATEQEQKPEEVEQVPEQEEQVPEQEQQVPEQEEQVPEQEQQVPEQEQDPAELEPQQAAEEQTPEQDQLPLEPIPVQEPSRLEYFIPNEEENEEPETVYIPLYDAPEELPEGDFVIIPQEDVDETDVPEEFPEDIIVVPEDDLGERMDVFVAPEEVSEGLEYEPEETFDVLEEVPEEISEDPEYVPEEAFYGPEEVPEEISEDPEYVPEEAFYGPEEVPEGVLDVPEEASYAPEEIPEGMFGVPEEASYGSEEVPEEIFGVPEEVSEDPDYMLEEVFDGPEMVGVPEGVIFDSFGTPEEISEDRFDGPQETLEGFSDVREEVPEGIMIFPDETFDSSEETPEDMFDGPQEPLEGFSEASEGMFDAPVEMPEEGFGAPEEIPEDMFRGPQEAPEGIYVGEVAEGTFVPVEVEEIPEGFSADEFPGEMFGAPEEIPEEVLNIPAEIPEEAFDGPEEAPEGFFDAPEEVYPDVGSIVPEIVPVRVSYMQQEFFENGQPEEDSEEEELVNYEPEEYPQEETYFNPPIVYFVPEGETFVPQDADYTLEEAYNPEENPSMDQEEEFIPEDMPVIRGEEYFPDGDYMEGEEQPALEDGAFMPEEEISNYEVSPDNENLPVAVIISEFQPNMSEETFEEDVPEQSYPQGGEFEGESLGPFLQETDNNGEFPSYFRPAVMMAPESEEEGVQEGDVSESSGPYVAPNFVEVVVIETSGNGRPPLPFFAQRPFDVQMQPEQLPVRPVAPIAGETFRVDEPLLPIAGEPQTDEADQLTPLVVDNQTFLIPNETDNQRIIFPVDEEPTQSLPVFPGQWDDEKHFFLPIRSEGDEEDQPLIVESFSDFEEQQPTQEFPEQDMPQRFRLRPQPLVRVPEFSSDESQDFYDRPQIPQEFGHFHPEPVTFQDSDDDEIIYPDYDTPTEYNTPFDYFMQYRYPMPYGGNGYYPQSFSEPSRTPDFTPQNYQLYGPRFGQQSNGAAQFYREYSPFNGVPARSSYRQGYQGRFQVPSGRVAPVSQYTSDYGYPWNYNYPSRRPMW